MQTLNEERVVKERFLSVLSVKFELLVEFAFDLSGV